MKRIIIDGKSNHETGDEVNNLLANNIDSFNDDYKSFIADTESESELQIVLRGHLYIEREITEMIRMILVEPNVILNDKFMFHNKLKLSVALGILPKEEKHIFEKINTLRNKYAHNLDFICKEEDIDKIFNSFSKELKKISKNYFHYNNESSMLNKLRKVVGVVWIYIRREHALLTYKLKMGKNYSEFGRFILDRKL